KEERRGGGRQASGSRELAAPTTSPPFPMEGYRPMHESRGGEDEFSSEDTTIQVTTEDLARQRILGSSSVDESLSHINRAVAPDWLAGLEKVPQVTQYKETSYALLQLRPGMTVLDLGCGVGDDARRLADLVQPGGSVIGVDARADMIAEARQRQGRST